MSIFEEKALLRKQIRKQMREMDPVLREKTDIAICRKTALLSQFQRASVIFCFIGVDWEIDTVPLIQCAFHASKRIAIPACVAPGVMEARFIYSTEHLKRGAYGIPEPPDNSPVCPPSIIDFAVVPCVSCDPACMRLGQGGGFYDRFMENASFFTAALCREDALLKRVPTEPWDCSVDCVVTESHTYFQNAKF